MAGLKLDRVTRRFGAFTALDAVSMDVADGELLAVLGPSGCGKTTLLRAVAGFDPVDDGRIVIGDQLVSGPNQHVPTEKRRVGIVFQSYALWPHMTVAENVGYALKVAKVPVAERERQIEDTLQLVGLVGFGARRPAELSGGQRQRVALARCLVMTPSLVLLDEPLANLDVHLRHAMEAELARLHRRTGTTMIYITHDQAEAMALADRIAVMDQGRVLQLASPSVLYREPANETVARFIGEGMVVDGEIAGRVGDKLAATIGGLDVTLRAPIAAAAHGRVRIALKPRDIAIAADDAPAIPATVVRTLYRGGAYRLDIVAAATSDEVLRVDVAEPCTIATGDAIRITIRDGWVIG